MTKLRLTPLDQTRHRLERGCCTDRIGDGVHDVIVETLRFPIVEQIYLIQDLGGHPFSRLIIGRVGDRFDLIGMTEHAKHHSHRDLLVFGNFAAMIEVADDFSRH